MSCNLLDLPHALPPPLRDRKDLAIPSVSNHDCIAHPSINC